MSEIKNPIANLDPKAIDQMVETFTAIGKAMREAVEDLLKEREWNHPSETDLLVEIQNGRNKASFILPSDVVERIAEEQDEPDSFVAPFQSKGTSVMDHDGGITPLTNEEDVARQNDYDKDKHGIPTEWNVAMAMARTVPMSVYLNVRRDLNEANVVKDMFEKQATNWGAELRTLYQLLDCVENNKAIDALKQLLAERDDLLQRLEQTAAANQELARANDHQADTIQELSEDKANHDSLRGEVDRVKRVNANQAEQLIQVKKGNEELAAANNRQAKVIEELRKDRDETLSELAKTKDRVEDLRAMLPSSNPVSTRPLAVDEQYNRGVTAQQESFIAEVHKDIAPKRVIKDAPQA